MKTKSLQEKKIEDRVGQMTKKLPVSTKRGHFGRSVKKSERSDIIKKLGE